MNNFKISHWITTCGIGKGVIAPGTIGSLIGLALVFFAMQIVDSLTAQSLVKYILALALIIGLFFFGIYYCDIYVAHVGREDPKEVIIDEVVGQLLTIWLCWPSVGLLEQAGFHIHYSMWHYIAYWALPFILFRFFDIIKPWPVSWADKRVKGGVGIMLDDILAAVLAATAQYSMVFILLHLLTKT